MQFCNRLHHVIGRERESFKVVTNSLDWEQGPRGHVPSFFLHEGRAMFALDLLSVTGGLELPSIGLFPPGDTVFDDAIR